MFISSAGSFKGPVYNSAIKEGKPVCRVIDGGINIENKKEFSNPIVTAKTFLSQISFSAHPKYPTYDSFTGLRDKKCLFTDLENLMAKKAETGENVSVAMFDMDNFKSVNELLGYKTGDEFIKGMSKNVGRVAKENNLNAYRFGGDEFVIVFDKQSKDEQMKVVESILQITNSDEMFKRKKDEYLKNADERLDRLGTSNAKIHELCDLKAKKSILEDLRQNLSTEDAKNDPYLQKSISSVKQDVKSLYLDLIDTSIEKEPDEDFRADLIRYGEKIEKGEPIEKEERNTLDEYLHSKFYKSLEIYQTKKWISDFRKNDGFSVTGGIVSFCPGFYNDKLPVDLIDTTGEYLKKGKSVKKGKGYFYTHGA